MRLTEFVIVIIAALMFLIPTMKKEKTAFERREAQEAEPMEEMLVEAPHRYKVVLEVRTPKEEQVADIMWMKKAASVARDAGIPYFNIVKQTSKKKFITKYKRNLSTIEGVIQLDNDPMRAEYDASEIESLVLTDAP